MERGAGIRSGGNPQNKMVKKKAEIPEESDLKKPISPGSSLSGI